MSYVWITGRKFERFSVGGTILERLSQVELIHLLNPTRWLRESGLVVIQITRLLSWASISYNLTLLKGNHLSGSSRMALDILAGWSTIGEGKLQQLPHLARINMPSENI